jgi:hypothetical protein
MRHTTCSRRSSGWARAALVAAVVATLLAACGGSDGTTKSKRTPNRTTTTPVPTAKGWESKFSDDELRAYREALIRWGDYKAAIQPFNAAGDATAAAKKVYQRYVIPWQVYFKRLERNAAAGIRIARPSKVLDSRATRIRLDSAGSSVTIRECVDSTDIGATQNGKPLANAFDSAQISDVILSQVNGDWLVSSIPKAAKDRPCTV